MTTPQQHLADIFVELAGGNSDVLLDPPALLTALAAHSREIVGARACGVLLAAGTGSGEVYASQDEARELVLDAHHRDQGPGPHCWATGAPVPRTDLRGSVVRHRWPHYVPRALALGYTEVAARPLRGRDQVIGALVLFGSEDAPLTDEALMLGQSLADIVAIVLLRDLELSRSRTLAGQLEHALTSRLIIEQAKGVLAAQRSLTMDEAFGILRGHARGRQRKLAAVAREVVEGRLVL
ncbi:GAF and ANTAR domain-containing protein [Streptomyces flavofungini]|uniref:GAF and ANTAR domain-containing protein n=1 Tax=Streptomyces flavofungini TaxID=68200 RepID=UPI0025B202BC|nr:GAF and ANTAR domain-containing protein [Streptomyces flavofungini]WJV47479.1 GAF and ANTAR domain-containing protein [Streptomyces flavofungini]